MASYIIRGIGAAACIILAVALEACARDEFNEHIDRVESYFARNLKARYMEQNCVEGHYPGWEGFLLKTCSYSVTDKNGQVKPARVVLLNPSPNQLARWIVHTCLIVKGTVAAACTDALSKQIMNQSGGQFPVAGVVYEDMYPPYGIFEAYCFRNGITVGIPGFKHKNETRLTETENQTCIFDKLSWAGQYARLQGTTRKEYRENGGSVDVGTSADRNLSWVDVSADLYKAAWGNDRNELMIAWGRQHL